MKTGIMLIFFALSLISLWAAEEESHKAEIRKGEVVLVHGDTVLLSVKIPENLGKVSTIKVSKIQWNPEGSLGISFVEGQEFNVIVGFFKSSSGKFKAVDLSPVEVGNLGMLGLKRQDLKSVSSKVFRWIERDDDLIQGEVETTVYTKTGKRMKARGPVILAKDGKPRWR